jgi:DNA-binding NtrC family response regulator
MTKTNEKILVVDDHPDIVKILEDRLVSIGYSVITASDGEAALKEAVNQEPDLILLDIQMPKISGMTVLKRLRSQGVDSQVILVTAFGTIEKAVEAMKEGAYDFITKPFSSDHMQLVIKKALEARSLKRENRYLWETVNGEHREVLGESEKIKSAIDFAKRAARSPATILLLGESGVGKEVFARMIHRESPRAKRPFVVINCVALRDELLESELFGHEKGSFTGALQTKQGKLEIAHGGTVFLDEIGDFKPELQVKLLRVLQEREFERVGGVNPIRVDIRILAATHRDIRALVRQGTFREDLFFRLNVITLQLPPLRERREDIPLLANELLRQACYAMKRPMLSFSKEAIESLVLYPFPGNVRELRNLIEGAVALSKEDILQPENFPLLSQEEPDDESGGYHEMVRNYSKRIIQETFEKAGGNQGRAAELLGLQRTYLSRLTKKLDL